MAERFDEIGIGAGLARAAEAAGYDRPTPLQAGAGAVIRRGGNVVLHASSGAGVTAAYGLPLLERLGEETPQDQPRALILTPTQQRAEKVARALATFGAAADIAVRAVAPGWRGASADVVVASVARALEGVQTSELKLDSLSTLVVTDASALFALDGGSALDTLITLIPKDAQRIVTSGSLEGDVQTFIDAHVRKALTVPARPAAPPRGAQPEESAGQIGVMIVEERSKDDILARLLEAVEAESVVVHARSAHRAVRVRAELAARGITNAEVRTFDDGGETAERVVSYDVPFSVDQLRTAHAGGGTVLVTPAERAHFRRIAGEAAFTVKQRRARSLDTGAIDAFRSQVRGALETEDLDSQLLVLEPLMEEHSAAEIAAALSALLRRRAPAAAPQSAAQQTAGAPPAEATAGGFTRLFVSVGARDNVRPGDIVGAITGEANIKGDQVGRVDIRESFSVVEVASSVAERVIRALNGTTMRGRSLRVDFDRKGAATGGGGRPQRGGPRERSGPRDRGGPPRRRPPERG